MPMRLSVLFTGNNRDLKRATREGRSELDKFKTTAVNVAGTLAGAYGAATTARAIFDTTKEVERLGSQLAVAMGGMEAGSRKFDQLNKFASDVGVNVQEVTRAFVQLRNVGLNPSEDAILGYMNTAGATGKSLEQFVEAVADATMGQFERLNEFGIKAQKEGDKIAIRFRGTTQLVENNAAAIEQYMVALGQNEFGGFVINQLDGVNAALSNLNNQWTESIKRANDAGLGEAIAEGIDVATDALAGLTDFIDENGDQIIDVGKAIATVFAARVAGSVGNASLAFIAHMAYQQQVTARYARMNGIAATAATRMRAVGTAARFSSRGMALLGGPVGIAALAAMAIYDFASEADDASKPTKSLKEQIDGLTESFENMTDAQRESARIKLNGRIAELEKEKQALEQAKASNEAFLGSLEARKAYRQLQKFKGVAEEDLVSLDVNSTVHTQAEVDKLTKRIEELRTKLDELKKPAKRSSDSLDNLNESLKKQAEEFGKVTLSITDQIYKLQEGEAAYERLTMARQMGVSLDSLEMEHLEKLIELRDRLVKKKEEEIEAERQRQAMQNQLGSLTQQLMPGVSATNQHANNMGYLDSAFNNPDLMPSMQVSDGEGGFREESEVEKKMRINQMIELEQQRHAQEMARINGDMSAQIDAMWSETFDRFAAGIGDAVATSIFEAKDFGEAMENIGKSAIKSVISGLVEIGVKKLALAALEKSTIISTNSTALVSGSTTAAGLAGAYAPAAGAASLALAGTNAPPAMSGMSAVAGLAGSLFAGMAHDGIGRVPAANEGTWLLKRGEMVMNPSQRENFEFMVSAMRQQRNQNGGNQSGASGRSVQIVQHVQVDARNAEAGVGTEVEEAMDRANEKFKQDLYDDFSNGGPLYQRLKASG